METNKEIEIEKTDLKEEEHIERIQSEQDDDFSNDDLFKITSYGADLSFRELIEQYEDKDLLKPELQRKFVWDKPEASRFVESLLLGLPVPGIFLAKAANEKRLIIDGYQRIRTVYDYVKGKPFSDESMVSGFTCFTY